MCKTAQRSASARNRSRSPLSRIRPCACNPASIFQIAPRGGVAGGSSKIERDRAVEAAALAELRRAHTDPAAVAQLIDCVENVDDVEADLEGSPLRDLDPALQTNVERFVRMIFLRVGKTAPEPVAVESIDGRSPIVPRIGDPGGTGKALIVV